MNERTRCPLVHIPERMVCAYWNAGWTYGFDVKALRTIIRMRKQDADERQEQETILETYMQALGML